MHAITFIITACVSIVGAFSSVTVSQYTHHSRCYTNVGKRSERVETCLRAEKAESVEKRRRQRNFEHWGVEHLSSVSSFPSTFEELADEVFQAIVGTIGSKQRVDPNIASNAMHKSVLDYRPIHPSSSSKRRWVHDINAGSSRTSGTGIHRKEQFIPTRMGIEIDGAHILSEQCDEGKAMRILSLHIAKRLSTLPWDDNESSQHADHRSVAVYYNSFEHSLLASRELSRWKKEEQMDKIHIRCLSQDGLPSGMLQGKNPCRKKQSDRRKDGSTEDESIVLIVKPTDIDADLPPIIHHDNDSQSLKSNQGQPIIQANVVDRLQSLLFQASASSIPAIVLSPRLSELPPMQQLSAEEYKRTGPSGFEQSGFQKSATYGGIEPPVGPTPWLLRGEKSQLIFILRTYHHKQTVPQNIFS